MLSAITDLPTGAVIVITSAILLLAAGTLPRLASRIRLPLARMAASLRSRNRE
jgi:hypothetical protein